MIVENPQFFYLFFMIPAILVVLVHNYIRNSKSIELLLSSPSLNQKFFIKFLILTSCQTLGFIFLILALVNFTWGDKYVLKNNQKMDICFAIDISKSMSADDVSPNRLVRAQSIAQSLLINSKDIRYSLVVFKGTSSILIPWTEDVDSIKLALSNLSFDTLSSEGTDIEGGLNKAINSFASDRESIKYLILFSDGTEEFNSLDKTISKAKQMGISINTITVGSNEKTYLKDDNEDYVIYNGEKVDITSNSKDLKKIAIATNGKDYTVDDLRLVIKIRENFLDNYAKLHTQTFQTEPINRYQIFLAISILLFLINIVVRILLWKKNM